MRILFTSDYLDPGRIGGSGRVILEVATRLLEAGHEVGVLAGGARLARSFPEFRERRLEWVSFPYPPAPRRGVRALFEVPRSIRSAYRALQFDPEVLIHNQPLTAHALRGVAVPAAYIFHSPWPLEYLAERYGDDSLARLPEYGALARLHVSTRRRIERRAVHQAARIVTLSESMKKRVIEIHGVPGDRVHVIPGGVDRDRFSPGSEADRARAREHWGVTPEELLLVAVRRLVPRTGIDLLLESFATAKLENARLLVAGTGPLEAELAARCRELEIEGSVELLGYVPDEELPDLYRAADLAVMPTRVLEGFGLATLEALSSGTPVVATPVGGSVEILARVHEELLAPTVTPDGLVRVLQRWAQDREALRKLGTQCASHVRERYSWDRMASTLEEEVEDVAAITART